MAKSIRIRRFCRGCNIIFTPERSNQVYHSEECRAEDYGRKYGTPIETEKECLECEELFATTCPKKQKYCRPECRAKAQKKQREIKAVQKYAETLTTLGERYGTFERDEFKCTVCGQGAKDTVLDVDVGGDGQLHTVCVECKAGKKFIKGGGNHNEPG